MQSWEKTNERQHKGYRGNKKRERENETRKRKKRRQIMRGEKRN